MNLNNKWSLNIDSNKWFVSTDYLKKTDFDSLKEDMKSFRFYQKCLSGSTYVGSNSKILGATNSSSILNIYDILQYNSYTQYYNNIGLNPLTYSESFSGVINEYPLVISNSEELCDFTKKSLTEYNLTLKNLFTPERLINDQKENIFYVDLATTDRLDSLSANLVGLSIDGIIVKEGHKILVKDQYNLVTIPTSSNPSLFFYGYYEEYEVIGTNTTYKIPNSDNGIYIFQNKLLVRTSDLSSYESIVRNSVCVKMGNTNREKQFHLKRLSNGYFPEYYSGELYPGGPSGESLYFEESHNFVIRQRVDYNNLYELSLKDTLKHATQSILVNHISVSNSTTFSYTVPERRIAVGEFGSIINHQENITNIINSKFKSTINSITQNSRYYWLCGDNGLLLKVDKIDFFITEINLKFEINNQSFTNIITPLNSISFYNDLVGCVVGDYNQIWVTMDGGNNWTQLSLEDFDGYNYNKISFVCIDKFYIGGDNGVFIEFIYSLGKWISYKRRISKYVDGLDDEYLLVDDITDLSFFTQSIYDYLAISCRGGSIYLYDISKSLTSTYSFLYLEDTNGGSFGDINSVVYNNDNSKLYFSTFESIYELDPINGILPYENSNIYSTTFSVFLTQSAINSIRSYEDELLMCGNFSLWIGSDLSLTYSLYDSTYFDRLKPRLLFLDYDIGSKLYWFDDYGQYRLPNKYSIPVGFLQGSGSFSSISFNQNVKTIHDGVLSITYSYLQSNWISYFKDSQKTFEYYTGLSQEYVVEPSFKFSSSNETGKTFSYSTQSITNRYLDIVGLMPSALPPMQLSSLTQSSRFREITGSSIELPSSTYSLYFYDYLGIWTDVFPVDDVSSEVGDVLNIQSDIFSGNFIINKIISTSSLYRSAQSAESQIRLFQLSTINASYSATMSISYGTHSILGTFSINSTLYPSPASNQLSNILYDITDQINLNTTASGFSAFYSYSSPNGIINLVAPTGATYNGSTVSIYFDYGPGETSLIQVIGPTEFIGGEDIVLQNRNYYYFYTDFNENILNNILNSEISIRNLNKYPQNTSLDSMSYFKDNFNSHYISHGYTCNITDDLISNTQSFEFTPKYSQWSAYYNLQSTIDVNDVAGVTYSDDILYPSGYSNFGYSPTYNVLNYLNFINDVEFVPTKEFYAMPNWISIPGPDNVGFSTQSSIYIDTGLETNRLYFGYELKYIWDSILEWTFIDLTMNYTTLSSFTSERLLIVKKYYQSGYYIIEFHDSIRSDYAGSVPGSGNNPFYYNIDTFTIKSRRTLQQISDDLQYINRMQRPKSIVLDSYDLDTTIGSTQGSWINYGSDINFKIPTDSYAKILLSDYSIIRELTGILYTDYKYELSMQITKLDEEYDFEVSNVSINGSNYQLDFSEKHLLNDNDSIVVSIVGTQTPYPENMLGYHNIIVNGDYSVVLPIQSVGLFGPSNLKISYIKKDKFLNYQPIDIFDMGIGDKRIKQSVEIFEKNWKVDGSIYNLIDLDLSVYKFRLIDGLDLVTLNSKFPWILEADISNAIIGIDKNGNLIWYTGVWNCGRWFGGTWISGYWMGGDWYYGNWTSKSIVDGLLQVKIDGQLTDYNSIWFDGRWFDGSWENGTWYDGRWYGGTWSNGTWFDGTWNDGTWNDGRFSSGIWVDGIWKNGYFNSDNGPSFWIDGKFFGGDFENGTWYNGVFDEKNNKKSRFGVKSFNSRNSIWKGGKFLSGEFHSFLNIDDYGNPDVSDVHKYSKWHTGIFVGGYFYGGLCYNINFKNTKWLGGISEDIQVINVDPDNNSFGLLGEYDFNINDEIYIVDNQDFNTFSYYGSTNLPKKYKILSSIYDVDNNITDIIVDINLKKSMTSNLLDGLWEVTYVESDYTGSLLQFFGYVDFPTSGDEFSEIVGSTMFIYNQNISYSQLNTPIPITGYSNFDTYYDNISIDLTPLNAILSSTCTYSISFGEQFLSATLSLTKDLVANPSGYTVNIVMSRLPISGTSTNLRAVSIFENSIWNSGLWYNGVFKDGTFNGGLWYNGYFEGTWG